MAKKKVAKRKSASSKPAAKGKKLPSRASRRAGAKTPKRRSAAKIHQGVGLKTGDPSERGPLTQAAVKIGAALGKADRTAHEIAKFGSKEIATISGRFGF